MREISSNSYFIRISICQTSNSIVSHLSCCRTCYICSKIFPSNVIVIACPISRNYYLSIASNPSSTKRSFTRYKRSSKWSSCFIVCVSTTIFIVFKDSYMIGFAFGKSCDIYLASCSVIDYKTTIYCCSVSKSCIGCVGSIIYGCIYINCRTCFQYYNTVVSVSTFHPVDVCCGFVAVSVDRSSF